jgi:cell wall-associated NlpC family hydrolase
MEILRQYAMSFLGTPYKYGGENRLDGMDCSEFVQELLRSVGLDPPGDQNSQMLFDHFAKNGEWNRHGMGALVFFGKDAKSITHVAMMLDQYRIIEAGGGRADTKTFEDAKKRGAMVRIRHLSFRKDVVAVIRPRYTTIGSL